MTHPVCIVNRGNPHYTYTCPEILSLNKFKVASYFVYLEETELLGLKPNGTVHQINQLPLGRF